MCCPSGNIPIPTFIYSLAIAPSIVAICAMAHYGRQLTETYVGDAYHKTLCLEAIAAFEMCANASELSIVADQFDVLSYTFYLVATSIWYSYNWDQATACPYIPIEEVVEGKTNYKEALQKIGAQLAGGFIGIYYINSIYTLEILQVHCCKSWKPCNSYIRIPFLMAILIEAIFACAYRMLSKYINNSEHKNANLIACIAGIMLVLVGREVSFSFFCYSGGNLNPVLSTVTKFNCCGTSPFKHFAVYWVGPCLGSIASLYAYPIIFK